ncbi:NAD(P)-binding domain-containing protein, partial [Actinocrinis sp.]|uniref:NAD(P)-binding domain-containing protein n=1 Tax=Actinocrinis sp. TaxID=1920516 RepID=UPI002D2C855B
MGLSAPVRIATMRAEAVEKRGKEDMAADNDSSGNTAAGNSTAVSGAVAGNGAPQAGAVTNSIGWIGTGRMGSALVTRLLGAGQQVAVCNRTRVKAEELAPLGAKVVDTPADLIDCRIVF